MSKFAIVPNEALEDPELTPSEFRVLVALYSFRDKNCDTVWPSLDKLADRARFKDCSQVSKVTTRLESKGWLTKASKMGFHGPKRYVLTVPDRLQLPGSEGARQYGENSQLGKFSQVGSSAQSGNSAQVGNSDQESNPQEREESPNLVNFPNLAGTTITNLDKTTNSQLGKNYQGYKEHTSKNIPMNSSEPNGSAAGAGKPAERSILATYEKYYDSPDQDDPAKPNLFSIGVRMMARANISEKRARATLAKMQTEFKPGPVLDAMLECLIACDGDPIGYLYAVLRAKRSPIPPDWKPGDDVVAELIDLGMNPAGVRAARDFFVFWMTERGATSADWGKYFKRWCIQDLERADFDHRRHVAWLARAGGFGFVEPAGGTL